VFDLYFAGSAGSLNLISHLAEQFQRNYRVVIFCATSGQFINSWKYLRGRYYVGLDWFSDKCFEAGKALKDAVNV
jgi:predicted patatin/cPLA2 family phospholipase